MLDMKTVVFSYFITNTLITLFIALLWYQNRKRYAGLAFWLIDFILQAVGFLLLLLRDVAPDLLSIVIAQMLIAAGALCIYIGLERFVGKPSSQIHNYFLIGGFVGLMAYFTFVQPDISIRTILLSVVTLLLTGQCSWLLFRRAAPSLRPITRDVGVVFLLYALVAFVRIIELAQIPLAATSDLFEAPSLQVVFVLINQLLCIALTFTLILMVTRRLELDVQAQEQNYASVYASMQEGMALHEVIYDATHHAVDYRILEVNPAYEKIVGLTRVRVVGQKASVLYGADEPPYLDIYANVAATQQSASFETYFPPLHKHFSISVFSPAPGRFATLFADITERKRAEEILFAQVRLMEFASTHSLDELLRQTLDEVGVVTDSPIGFFHFVQADQKTLSLQAWSTRTLDEYCTAQGKGLHYDIDAAGVWVDCVQQRRPVIHNDYASLPHRKGLPEGHAPVIRELVVPIMRGERIVAILGVGNKPTDYNEQDVQRVSYFADMAWEIVERKRAEREIEHLASFPQLNANPILEIDASGTVTYQNQATAMLLTQTQQDARILFPPDLPMILETLAQKCTEVFYREIEIDHRVFGENIHLVPEFNVARIYTIDITERKQAEEALKESEANLRGLLEQLPIGVSLLDQNRKMIYANPALVKILDVAKEDLLQGKYQSRQYILPDGTPMPPEQFASVRAFQEQQPIRNVETGVIKENGETIWASISAAPFSMVDQGVVVATVDITERKRAEDALVVSEVRYRRLFEAARDGILILDAATGMVVDVNPFLIEMLGFPREQFLEKRIWELGFFKDIVANRANFEELQRKEYIRYENLPLETRAGRQIEVEFVSNVYWVNHHKVIQCNVRDITERKRAEEKLRRRNQYLAALQETTLELLSQLDLNVLLENIVKRAGALMGTTSGFLDLVDPTTRQLKPRVGVGALAESLHHIVQPGEGLAGIVWQTGKPLVIEDYDHWAGRIGNFSHGTLGSIIGVPLLSGAQVLGVFGLAYDFGAPQSFEPEAVEMLAQFARLVTLAIENARLFSAAQQELVERKRAEAALQKYSDRLEQMVDERTCELRDAQDRLLRQERLTVLGQIAGGIGHELRSPLGAIKNAVYLLNLALPAPDPDVQETLQILKRQVDASDRIITSLLDLARPKPPLRRETDLRETIDAALSQAMVSENVAVCRQFDDALPALLVDPTQLQIVFHNLIRNAVQAMPSGGQLTIATHTSDDEVSIAFGDTGSGIAPEDLAQIFQPLFSTKSRGLGIGLALSKLLVDGHQGRIDVTSQVGTGTTFVVCLPRSGQAQDLPLLEVRNE